MSQNLHPLLSRFGTAIKEPARMYSGGEIRWEIDPYTGAMMQIVAEEPVGTYTRPVWFFRQSGGRWQVCVRFPTGATQILATEP